MIAKNDYTQNFIRHIEIDLSVIKEDNELVLRYIVFIKSFRSLRI